MKRSHLAVLLFVVAIATLAAADKKQNESGRMLSGKVTDHQGTALPDAIVYLTDTRTRAIKTYIVSSDGMYRFPALSQNVDYEVYAQYKGQKSDTKTMSQFDDRFQVTINLRIDMK
jgi:Carboxypeptidase regulatory-like domain